MIQAESYILCEGFHDRAFWAGMLQHFGCSDPGLKGKTRVPVSDPWGLLVRGSGEYGFHSRSGEFIRVVPAGSKTQILPLARMRLNTRSQKVLTRLILNCDSDVNADGTAGATPVLSFEGIVALARECEGGARLSPPNLVTLDDGGTTIVLAEWHAADPVSEGVPNQNSLERLMCSAIKAVYPDYGQAVERWLKSRPSPPPSNPKEHALSYLAGWYAELGSYEAFCTVLWRDARIAPELESRVRSLPFWNIIEALTA